MPNLAYFVGMGVIQVQLPEQLQQVVDREVAEGRVASESEFLIEAARRFVEDLALEDEIVSEAEAGIADAEAGRFVTVATRADGGPFTNGRWRASAPGSPPTGASAVSARRSRRR